MELREGISVKIIYGIVIIVCFGMIQSLTAAPQEASRVDLENVLSKLKLKGRAAIAYFDSGKAGAYSSGSFEMPDIKLQFGFNPDEKNSLTLRFNLNNATAQNPLTDYLFLQSKDFLPWLKETPFSLSGRVGRFKQGFGEETGSNNSIENPLPTNSAADAGMTDEAFELSGKYWIFSIGNGNRGVGSDNAQPKSIFGKIFYSPLDPLYLSASYYQTGELKASGAEFSLAGLSSPPLNTKKWSRRVWEADIRYDFGKGQKPRDPIMASDSDVIIRASYGKFDDVVQDRGNRNGQFGFTDVLVNCPHGFFVAARASIIDLDGDQKATLNSVETNHYRRFSAGGGYRWTDNVHIKIAYDLNRNGGAGSKDVSDNLFSTLLAVRF